MFFRPIKIVVHSPKLVSHHRNFSSSNKHKPIKYFSKIPSHSSILMQVVENSEMRNKHISEALLEHEFKKSNSTAIRFYISCEKNAAAMESALKTHKIHNSFIVNIKGHFEMHAQHSLYFLQSLVSIKKTLISDFIIGKNAFEEFISALEKNNFLSETDAHAYRQEIKTDLTIKEMETLAHQTNDPAMALELAELHKDDLQLVLYWIEQALEFKPTLKIEEIHDKVNLYRLAKRIHPETKVSASIKEKIEDFLIKNTLDQNSTISLSK